MLQRSDKGQEGKQSYLALNWDIRAAWLFDAECRRVPQQWMRATSDQKLLERSERMARQEERVSTHQENCESALDRLQAYMAEHEARRDADMEYHFSDIEKQHKADLRWLVGMWIAGILVFAALVHWPF